MASSLTMEVLTAEPAVVVPTIQETEMELNMHNNSEHPMRDISMAEVSRRDSFSRGASQHGATLRRASTILRPPAALYDDLDVDLDSIESMGNEASSAGDFFDCISEHEKQK